LTHLSSVKDGGAVTIAELGVMIFSTTVERTSPARSGIFSSTSRSVTIPTISPLSRTTSEPWRYFTIFTTCAHGARAYK
jgi:hypothetical protein